MDTPQDSKDLDYLWTKSPSNSDETIKERPPLPVSLAGVVQEQPRYIRDVDLKGGAIIQMVTTPTLKRGYIARAVDDYLSLLKKVAKARGMAYTPLFQQAELFDGITAEI